MTPTPATGHPPVPATNPASHAAGTASEGAGPSGVAPAGLVDRYWWHNSIATDLRRSGGYNVKGIASNCGFTFTDTKRYVDEMLGWGELVEIEPMWDTFGVDCGRWVALAINELTAARSSCADGNAVRRRGDRGTADPLPATPAVGSVESTPLGRSNFVGTPHPADLHALGEHSSKRQASPTFTKNTGPAVDEPGAGGGATPRIEGT